MSVKDKIILITGASDGIGKTVALEFAKKGEKIMSGDCREQPVIFYSEEMTVSKMILLSQQGVVFKKYEYLLDVLEEEEE